MRSFLEQAEEVGKIGSWVSGLGDQDVLWWSAGAYRIFGVAPGAPITVATFFAAVHPDDRAAIQSAVSRAIEERRPYAIDHRVVHPDGEVRWVQERADVVFDAAGKPLRLVGVVQDITEQRRSREARERLEAQLLQTLRLDSIGRLAGGVAHDFNNLLTAISGYAELMLADLKAEDALREPASEIKRASARAGELTRQLLAFGRRQVLQPQVLCLNDVVREMERMLRRLVGEDVKLVIRLDPDLGRVRADPAQLEQVVMNLVANARDAMPRGGELTIETSVELAGRRDGETTVVLAVSDSGCGMDPETVARCFEPFFTTKPGGQGTGLGLSTVWGIVKQSSGNVTVQSQAGRGTTFRVQLPLVEPAPAPVRPPEPAQPAPASATDGGETVLLVEDDDLVRGLAVRTLRARGYSVLEAASGADALRVFQEHGRPIDLLLSDVVLPGQSGPEVAAQLVKLQPRLRILFMSGYSEEAVQRHGVLVAGAGFLPKPFAPTTLVSRVRAALSVEVRDPLA